MHKSGVYPLLAVLTICLALPAGAQTRDWDVPPGGLARNDAECHAQFNRVDRNGDGVLTPSEIRAGRGLITPRLTTDGGVINRQEFLSACSEGVRSLDSGS